MNFTEKLADTPDQSTLQPDDNWGTGIIGGIRADDIGFRSGRTINLAAGDYTFYLGSDDGSRLWIDGTLCIDNWGDHGYQEKSCTKTYTSSGDHQFRIDYYENGGDARAHFYYSYIVVNPPPSAINLSVNPPNSTGYCGITGYPPVRLRWQFSDPGDSQSAYQIQVDNNSDFSSPIVDTGKVISNSRAFLIGPPYPTLSWNTTYYWRLRVWDSQNTSSTDWIVYQNNIPPSESFTTAAHAYPDINFSWSPVRPTVNEVTQFTDLSEVYGGATKSAWLWQFQDGDPVTSTLQNPKTKLTSTGTKIISLKVTDSTDYSCTGSKTVNISPLLPGWEEISPF